MAGTTVGGIPSITSARAAGEGDESTIGSSASGACDARLNVAVLLDSLSSDVHAWKSAPKHTRTAVYGYGYLVRLVACDCYGMDPPENVRTAVPLARAEMPLSRAADASLPESDNVSDSLLFTCPAVDSCVLLSRGEWICTRVELVVALLDLLGLVMIAAGCAGAASVEGSVDLS